MKMNEIHGEQQGQKLVSETLFSILWKVPVASVTAVICVPAFAVDLGTLTISIHFMLG